MRSSTLPIVALVAVIGKPAEAVVRSRLHHHHIRRTLEHPVEAAEQPRRGLPAHPRVHHLVRQAGRVDLALDALGIRAVGIEPQPRRQRRAQEEDGASSLRLDAPDSPEPLPNLCARDFLPMWPALYRPSNHGSLRP